MNKCIILFLIVTFSFVSCEHKNGENIFSNSRSKLLTLLEGEETIKINEMSNEIIRCFTQKDKNALIELFCDEIQNGPDFNNEIDKMLEYFNCDIYSFSEKSRSGHSGFSTNEGRRTEWNISVNIPYICVLAYKETNIQNEMDRYHYAIQYSWCIINEENKSFEGLYYMNIELLNINSINIGDYNLLWKK